MKHNTAHSHADDIRKNQVLEALGGKAFRGATPLSFAGLMFLPHLVVVGETCCQEPPLCPSEEFCMDSQFMMNLTLLILLSQYLPHHFHSCNPKPFSFHQGLVASVPHSLSFGAGHSCSSKVPWKKLKVSSEEEACIYQRRTHGNKANQ